MRPTSSPAVSRYSVNIYLYYSVKRYTIETKRCNDRRWPLRNKTQKRPTNSAAVCFDTPLLWFPGIKLQHTATHTRATPIRFCYGLPVSFCHILQHAATHCNTLQHNAIPIRLCYGFPGSYCHTLQHAATHCNSDTPLFWFTGIILQHTATHIRNSDTPLL